MPHGLRETLAEANVLSYRVLWFEREGGEFIAPSRWPARAAACVSTHDLPTIVGWWNATDLDEREAVGQLTSGEADTARSERTADKRALLAALERAGVTGGAQFDIEAPCDDALAAAIHRFVGISESALALVQADDLAGETSALNLPGTDRERVNWRRRIGVAVEDLWNTPLGQRVAADGRGQATDR